MKKEVRFHYDGSWTRWFKTDEDLSYLVGFKIDKVEVSEEMTREDFNRQFPDLAIGLTGGSHTE